MENNLKGFLIKKFIVVMTCIGIIEGIINIINSAFVFPLMKDIFELDSNASIKLTRTEIFIIFIMVLLQLLIGAVGQTLPNVMSGATRWLTNRLSYALERAVPSMSVNKLLNSPGQKEEWFFFMFILAIMVVLITPYIIGALYYAKVTVKEVEKLQEERDKEKREYDRRRNLMLSDIAHDLRTPITTVAGYAKALSDGMIKEEEKQKEYLLAMQTKSARMDDLINLLFEYVKLDSEGFVLNTERLDVCELLRENAALIYSDLEDNGFIFDIDIPEEQYFINADKIQLSRVITNLIVNAQKHNEGGTRILLQMIINENEAFIRVVDSGADIPKEIEQTIFEPFAKADKSRSNASGSGLGLSIAKKIVDKHGFRLGLVRNIKGYTKGFEIIL